MTSQGSLMTSWRGLKASQREEGLLEASECKLEGSDDQPEGAEPAGSLGRVQSPLE